MSEETKLLKNLDKFIARVERGKVPALKLLGNHIIEKATTITPIDTGNLRSSANVTQINKDAVAISYSAEYAGLVHETNQHYRVGSWHFLTNTVGYHGDSFSGIFARELRGILGRRGNG